MYTSVNDKSAAKTSPTRRCVLRYGAGRTPAVAKKETCANVHASAVRLASAALAACSILLSACHIAPKYVRPPVEVPSAYKELGVSGSKGLAAWKKADPKDDAIRGKWWEVFNDPQLNALEERVDVSDQSIAAAAATFLAARAMVREARSQYFPSVAGSPSIMNSLPSPGQFGGLRGSTGHGLSVSSFTNYSLPFDASWEPDLWSRVRLAVRTNYLAAQVSAADLENVRLTVHAELAVDYYELRGQDALKQLLDSTVLAYQEALDLTRAQYKTGIGTDEAVAAAETQLAATQAQDTNLGILRAQYEHAIALLIGEPASTFSIPAESLQASPPDIPVGIPSELLERRPDIAAAERAVAQANAQIGVAKAAFFPNLILGATAGFGNTSIADWLTWPGRFWSMGPGLTETVFDAGLRRATVQQFQASHDQAVANYRQGVLTAFQQVEDSLASSRILSQDVQQQDAAVRSANRNLQEAMVRYQAGIDPYLNVITAQTLLLNAQQTVVNFQTQQMTASVQLIEALGGGWDASQIPPPKELRAKSPWTSNASSRDPR
ncbi:MAG TPA: efflux transporter outer membrane subunit [Terriglobia bacterium]|nr:efflux transporter outer membrane subunit [Terriglobia bacterium]